MFGEKLNKYNEEDFVQFRVALESGKLSPKRLIITLVGGILGQLLLALCLFIVADPQMFPGYFKDEILIVVYFFTSILIIFSIVFLIPFFYRKNQRMQYIISSVNILNILSVMPLFCSLFFLVRNRDLSLMVYLVIAVSLIVFGMGLYWLVLCGLRKKIQYGGYRNDVAGKRNGMAVRHDNADLSQIPSIIFGGAGFAMIVGSLGLVGDTLVMIIMLLLYLTGIYLFAQARLIMYCKRRFRSFNFSEEGHLYPWGSGDRLENKNRVEQN